MVKHFKQFILLAAALLVLTSCSKDDDATGGAAVSPARRTVIVYMAGENNLSGYIDGDISEMMAGRKLVGTNEQLVLFVDRADKQQPPYIVRVTPDGKQEKLYQYEQDFYASDPDAMRDVLERCIAACPAAEDYGLVLWGPANGWVIEKDSIATHRAYGIDSGDNTAAYKGMMINMPTLRRVLEQLPIRFKYIFCDCCNMANAETAYELRNMTDIFIGSPSEIPAEGAPYIKVVPDLFDHSADFYKRIIDDYAEASYNKVPLAAINTAATASLAAATRQVLAKVNQSVAESKLAGYIYYYNDYNKSTSQRQHLMYDIKEVVRKALADDETAYQNWLSVLNQTVLYQRLAKSWTTNQTIAINFSDFTVTEENFSGLSMFFPMEKYNSCSINYNEEIKKLAWYYAVGWSEVGW